MMVKAVAGKEKKKKGKEKIITGVTAIFNHWEHNDIIRPILAQKR